MIYSSPLLGINCRITYEGLLLKDAPGYRYLPDVMSLVVLTEIKTVPSFLKDMSNTILVYEPNWIQYMENNTMTKHANETQTQR